MSNFHQDVWQMERAWDHGYSAWERWLDTCEKLYKPEYPCFDGDHKVDGYSLDTMYDYYREGLPPKAAVARLPKR